jgi:LysM repeat protein
VNILVDYSKNIIMYLFRGQLVTIPTQPDTFKYMRGVRNETIDIVGTGQVILPRTPDLWTFSYESIFWQDKINENKGSTFKTVQEYLEWFEKWRDEKKPARFIVPFRKIDTLVFCQNLPHEINGGETEDIYYSTTVIQHREFGSKKIEVQETDKGAELTEVPPEREDPRPSKEENYIAVSGDSLWKICRKYGVDGTRWGELYELNKEAIGANPHKIYPGQEFKIPESWL